MMNMKMAVIACCCLLLSLGTSACDVPAWGGTTRGGGATVGSGTPSVAATPEMDSLVLFASGLVGAMAYIRLRRRAR